MIRSLTSYVYVLIYVAAQSVALAQQTPTFGLVTDLRTGRRTRELVGGDFNGDAITDVAAVSDLGIDVHLQAADSLGFRSVFSLLTPRITEVHSGNINGDGITDLVALSQNPCEIHVFLGRSNGAFTEKWNKTLPDRDYHVAVADINSDGRSDIILYSKKEPGIAVFPGNGNGTFRARQTILEDVSFTALEVRDMNGDRLNDIVGINWISNEVDIFLAYGRMKYGNPSVIAFENEPSFIVPASLDTLGLMDLIVGFSEGRLLHIYHGNGFGEFTLAQTIPLEGVPDRVIARDINDDGRADLLILNNGDRSLGVWLNNSDGGFDQHADFAAGISPLDCIAFGDRHAGRVDLAILDSASSRIRVMYNSNEKSPRSNEIDYATGLSPMGIVAADLNNDRRMDLVVANMVSQNYAVFLNRGPNGMSGQIAYPVVMNPTKIYDFPNGNGSSTLLLAGKYEDKALINDINLHSGSRISYSIPTLQDPVFLGRVRGSKPGLFDFIARETDRSAQKMFLTRFEQVAPKRFVEKNITPAIPFIAGAVTPEQPSGKGSVYVLTYDPKRKMVSAYRVNPADMKKLQSPSLFSVPAPVKPNAFLWSVDMNNDGMDDMIFNIREPENSLFVALGNRDSTFSAPQPLLSDEISIASREGLKIADINGDGVKDFIVENDLDKSIQAYLGKGDGQFSPKMRLTSSLGIGGFEVADVDDDGLPELILLDTAEGLVRIIQLNQ